VNLRTKNILLLDFGSGQADLLLFWKVQRRILSGPYANPGTLPSFANPDPLGSETFYRSGSVMVLQVGSGSVITTIGKMTLTLPGTTRLSGRLPFVLTITLPFKLPATVYVALPSALPFLLSGTGTLPLAVWYTT